MLLVIDNYDSFTYNLVQHLGEIGAEIRVVMNDQVSVDEIDQELKPDQILISPGPGTPDDAGISLAVIERFAGRVPILGVCLGHQAIGQYFGATVERAPLPVHGKAASVRHCGEGLFSGVPSPFPAGRYHSLCVSRKSIPDFLEITAETDDGIVMALRHSEMEIHGVQFHPESVLTEHGRKLLHNFVRL
jgi:para-aminobenzoate synthetase component II